MTICRHSTGQNLAKVYLGLVFHEKHVFVVLFSQKQGLGVENQVFCGTAPTHHCRSSTKTHTGTGTCSTFFSKRFLNGTTPCFLSPESLVVSYKERVL